MNTKNNFSSSDDVCVYADKYLGLGNEELDIRLFIKEMAKIFLRKLEQVSWHLILNDQEILNSLRYTALDLKDLNPIYKEYLNYNLEFKAKIFLAIKEAIKNASTGVNAGLFAIVNEDIINYENKEDKMILTRSKAYISER